MTPEAVANQIMEYNGEDLVHSQVDEMIPEYLDDGWEDEFDSAYEAYQEQGRGEAENAVLNTIINTFLQDNKLNVTTDVFIEVFDLLKEEWSLNNG